jgi:hypothetical protein
MAADTWLLMKLYWKLDRREVTGQSKLRILAYVLGGIGILFIGAFSAAVGYFASFLLRPEMPVRVPPGLVPGLILTFVLISVLITGLNQAVKSLFLSGDLDRLMVAPVHTRSVMVAKLLSRLPSSFLLLLLIAAPAWVAYGIGMGAGPVYYLLGAVLLLLAPLFGLSVGAVIAMLLVRWLPVNRVNELLAAAYALFGIGIALLFQLPRFFLTGDEEEMVSSVSGSSLSTFVETIDRLPIPTLWAGRGLTALDAGQIDATGLLGLAAYVLMTLGLFALIILTADRLYLSGWLKTQSAGGKRRGLEEAGGAFGGRSLAAAIGWKDWLLRLRDPRQLINLLGGGLIAIVVGALTIFRDSGGGGSLISLSSSGVIDASGGWAALTAVLSPGVLIGAWALFIGFALLSNASTNALALEGGAFAMFKAAPIRPREVWSAKLVSLLLPYVALFTLVMVGAWFFVRYSLAWLPYALAAGLILGYGLMALNVSVGFRYANLAWTDPRRMISGGGGWVSFLLSVLYGLPAGIITLLGFSLAAVWPAWAILFALAALLLLALYTALWHRTMARWAEKAWDKLPV